MVVGHHVSNKIILSYIYAFHLPATDNYCDIYHGQYGYSYLIAAVNATLFTLLLFWITSKTDS